MFRKTCVCLLVAATLHGAAGKDFEIVELERTPVYSVHRVRIWTQEVPHIHAQHDSKVVLETGGGILYLNGIPKTLRPGDEIEIPRNVPHYFVHQSSGPYSQARVTFTPPFDGKDRIPVQVLKFKPIPDKGQILNSGQKPPSTTLEKSK